MIKDSKYIELVHRRLVSQISREDSEVLEAWLSESEENKVLASDIEKTWQHSESYLSDYRPDVEDGLEKLKSRIREEDEKGTNLHIASRRKLILGAVAAIALLAVVTIALNTFLGSSTPEWVTVKSESKSTREIKLDDGSTVWLNENSSLSYPKQFNGRSREVKLSGEAYFDISPDEEKPFSIQADQARVKVLGTTFNVRAYPGEEEIELTVESGRVQFDTEGIDESVILTTTDSYFYNKKNKSYTRKRDKELNALSWRSRRLAFRKASFGEVVKNLQRFYGIEIEIGNDGLKNCTLTANFDNTPLKDVFEILKVSLSLEVRALTQNRYILQGEACK